MPESPNGSNTTLKQRGGVTGKGFVKGDPRINRNGRPRSFDQAREIVQAIAHEQITLKNGKKIELAEAIFRRWANSNEPQLQKAFIEYCYGKVPDKIEATGLENKTNLILHFDHEKGVTRE